MKVGTRVKVFNLNDVEAFRGVVTAVNRDEWSHAQEDGIGCHCTVTVLSDDDGEDHEIIAALVVEE